MLYPKQTNCSENGNINSLISSIDCRLSKLANTMFNNTVFMLNKTISGTEMFDLIQYKRILYYKQINPDYVDCYSVNQIASQVKRFTANCTGNCNGNSNDNSSNIFPAPPIRTTTTTSSTTCPPTTSTTSSTTTNTTTCKPSGLTFFTLTTEIVYESITYNFSEMTILEICDLLISICYPYTGDFTYTTEVGETTAIETGNIIFDPFTPCTFLPDGTYLEGVPGDSCGTVANIFDVLDGVITEVVTTCNVVTTTTTTTSPPEQFKMIADGVIQIDVAGTTAGILIDSLGDFKIIWGDGIVDSFTAGNNRVASHSYDPPYTGDVIIETVDLSNITRLLVNSTPNPGQSLSVTTTELGKLDNLSVFSGASTLNSGLFVTGDVINLPRTLTRIDIRNTNISGLTSNFPSSLPPASLLTFCTITGNNTISGNTLGLPRSLSYLNIQGSNTINGLTSDLPRINNTCIINGNNTISGTTLGLPPAVEQIEIRGNLPLFGNTINGDVDDIFPSKNIWLYGKNTVDGDVSGFKSPTELISIHGNNSISGDVAGLPITLKTLDIQGNNTISGNFSGLPPALTFIILNSPANISVFGDVDDLPKTLVQSVIKSSGVCTGNLYNLPPPIRSFSVNMGTNLLTYTSVTPRVWADNFYILSFPPDTRTGWAGFSVAETDKLLIEIQPYYVTFVGTTSVFAITCESDPPRSSLSDAAYNALGNLIGFTNVDLN